MHVKFEDDFLKRDIGRCSLDFACLLNYYSDIDSVVPMTEENKHSVEDFRPISQNFKSKYILPTFSYKLLACND